MGCPRELARSNQWSPLLAAPRKALAGTCLRLGIYKRCVWVPCSGDTFPLSCPKPLKKLPLVLTTPEAAHRQKENSPSERSRILSELSFVCFTRALQASLGWRLSRADLNLNMADLSALLLYQCSYETETGIFNDFSRCSLLGLLWPDQAESPIRFLAQF